MMNQEKNIENSLKANRKTILEDGFQRLKSRNGFIDSCECHRCCSNCEHFDTYSDDFGMNYESYCSNKKNELDDSKPGEPYTWNIDNPDNSTCNLWKPRKSVALPSNV